MRNIIRLSLALFLFAAMPLAGAAHADGVVFRPTCSRSERLPARLWADHPLLLHLGV